MIPLVALLAGCAEYSVWLEPVSDTPLVVNVGWEVEMPVGIVVTAYAHAQKDGTDLDSDTDIGLSVDDPLVLNVSPVVLDDNGYSLGEWALTAVAPGTTTIWPTVDGREATPIVVLITEQ